jgi:hypothetical protein
MSKYDRYSRIKYHKHRGLLVTDNLLEITCLRCLKSLESVITHEVMES